MDYVVLADELTVDPLGRGYASMNNNEAADDLNLTYRSFNKPSMTSSEILENIDATEFAALTSAEVGMVNAVLSPDSVDPFGNAQAILLNVFQAGSATIIALAASRVENISRAEELGLPELNAGHIAHARG